MKQELDQDWLTLKQAMAYMQCGPGTLMKYIKDRKIEAVQLSGKNGSWKIKSASIQRFMETGGR